MYLRLSFGLAMLLQLVATGCVSKEARVEKVAGAEEFYINSMKDRFTFSYSCSIESLKVKVIKKKTVYLGGWAGTHQLAEVVGISGCQKKKIYRIYCDLNSSYTSSVSGEPGCLVLEEGAAHAAILENNKKIKTFRDKQRADANRRRKQQDKEQAKQQQQRLQRLNSYGTSTPY